MKRFLLVVVALLVVPTVCLAAGAVSPDVVKAYFDASAAVIMFAWGLLHTRLPVLAKVPNAAIPWVNLVGYILAKLAVPDAHAGIGADLAGFGGLLWLTARGAATSAVTSLLYDKFAKAMLDRMVPKAVAKQ